MDMIKFAVLSLAFVCSVAFGADTSDMKGRLIKALAEANHTSVNAFDGSDASLTKSDAGFILKFDHSPGEGSESCEARYRSDATLETFECEYVYAGHSMGAADAKSQIKAKREYNQVGKLIKVSGEQTETRLNDGKTKTRKIRSVTDKNIAELARPILKLPEDLRVGMTGQ